MDPEDCLNVLEQRPGWAWFSTNIAWCFACPETADIPAIVGKLQHALEDLASVFPWIAGQVINEGSDPANNNTGVFKIIGKDSAPKIFVKDHRQTPSVPDMNKLRQAGFATKSLDEALFAPRPNFSLDRSVLGHVLLVQVSIISGGLILVFSGNHSATELKARATATRTTKYVSTDDAFSAFLWQSLARVRLQRLGADKTSTVARACNARRFLGIPSTYPGLVQNTIYIRLSLGELAELPLGAVASILRDAIASESPSVEFYTRAVATVLSRSVDKGCMKVAAWMDRSSDVLLSSFTAIEAYDQDFDLGLGRAEAVRLTNLVNHEGMMFFLPAEPSGDIGRGSSSFERG